MDAPTGNGWGVRLFIASTVSVSDTNTDAITVSGADTKMFLSSRSFTVSSCSAASRVRAFAPAPPPLTRPALADVGEPHKEALMKTYKLALEMVREVAEINKRIDRHDRDLARQLRRASMSVPLNINEGMYSRGRGSTRRRAHQAGSLLWSIVGEGGTSLLWRN